MYSSRAVAGFYLSLEAPGAAATGMCVACAILPKDSLLARWGIGTPWPVSGKMAALHCDNGKDFRGAMLRQACEQHAIELLFRPVRQPHYGGHIERLMGTFAREIHTLPGTTFANPGERKGYDSEKRSALTIAELESWLARYIFEVYHQRPHSGLEGRSPIAVYEEGIARTGLPELCITEEQLRLDFMPLEQRAVTVNGIVVDISPTFMTRCDRGSRPERRTAAPAASPCGAIRATSAAAGARRKKALLRHPRGAACALQSCGLDGGEDDAGCNGPAEGRRSHAGHRRDPPSHGRAS